MSGSFNERKLSPDDAYKFLVCESHIGSSIADFQNQQYVFKRRLDGVHLINLGYTWEKILLAARAIAAIKNPADICVVSGNPKAQRALLKFAAHTGASSIVGRFVPGSFTNQIQKNFKEPSLVIVADPRLDFQPVKEAASVNIPVIAFTSTDTPLKFVDIAIPCNNKSIQSVGLLWWMLAREVLRLRGRIGLDEKPTKQSQHYGLDLTTFFTLDGKQIMPDLYFHREIEEQKSEEGKEKRESGVRDMPIEVDEVEGEIQWDYAKVPDWAATDEPAEGEYNVVEEPEKQFDAPKQAEEEDEW
jgi:small subunit ribosomal protein SAe